MKEIRRYQKSFANLIPRTPFARVVREIFQDNHYRSSYQFRIQASALDALRDAAESFLVRLFEDVQLCCLHAKRKTILPIDFRLALRISQGNTPCGMGQVEYGVQLNDKKRVEEIADNEEDSI